MEELHSKVLQGCIDCEDYGKGEHRDKLEFLNSYQKKMSEEEFLNLEEEIIKLVSEKERFWFEQGFSHAWELFSQRQK